MIAASRLHFLESRLYSCQGFSIFSHSFLKCALRALVVADFSCLEMDLSSARFSFTGLSFRFFRAFCLLMYSFSMSSVHHEDLGFAAFWFFGAESSAVLCMSSFRLRAACSIPSVEVRDEGLFLARKDGRAF